MAATKTASRNDTPNTPEVSESKIARMKVDELRRELKKRGTKGTADLKKPELVKKLIKAAKSDSSSGRKSSGGKNATSRNDTPNTPAVSESKIARRKADDLRRELKNRGVKGTADLKKPELVKKMIKLEVAESKDRPSRTKSTASKSATTKSATAKSARTKSAAVKTKSAPVKKKDGSGSAYAQEIRSTDDRPERYGRSLVTTDHAVIQQWAKARKATPATVAGTDHDGHLGVLRLDFPGYSGDRLVEVSWDDWFEAFDKRRLNFIFQQRLSNGRRSNFFQLENPEE